MDLHKKYGIGMNEIINICSALRDNIIIDCGHTLISTNNKSYSFGKNGTPSPGEIESFRYGIKIFKTLKNSNKNARINLYLSDLVGIRGGNKERRCIYAEIHDGNKEKYIPKQYIELLVAEDIDYNDILINLQSKGNTVFKKTIKKVCHDINSIKHHPSYQESLYEKYNTLFLTSKENSTLSIFSPFLMNDEKECDFFDGTWWRYEDININNLWLIKLPLLRLKINPIINLYESGGRMLCPATYAGLISLYDNSFDHVAVYSREDDEYIGEKVIRGVIASNALDLSFSRNCIQVILTKDRQVELSYISNDDFHHKKYNFSESLSFVRYFMDKNSMKIL
ncbi:hypothetical protein N4188_005063 [Salmonella enterica]|nr:hypothetical protein [Salmonella enterica]